MYAASKLTALLSSLPVEEGEASDFSLAWDSSVAAAGKCQGAGGTLLGVLREQPRESESHSTGYENAILSSCCIPVSSPDFPIQHDYISIPYGQ